jgi:hypothetical protein
LIKARDLFRWLPSYAWQRITRRPKYDGPVHLIIALADHFEPSIFAGPAGVFADRGEQEQRVERWCRNYPKLVNDWRDAEGRPFRHTYFYPAEQYDKSLVERLAQHCHDGWGEIEVHLHHGVAAADTPENTRRQLVDFRDALAAHGCLSQLDGVGAPRYAFVHGNWALANSAGGRCCGVDNEMQILAETGCYADFTLPSAPSEAQTAKINAIYECGLPLDQPAPHRSGRDLECGRTPTVFPLIIQGPLMLDFGRRKLGLPFPRLENGELSAHKAPASARLRLWRQAAITVRGRHDWVFVKLHCHGMDPRHEKAMLGELMRDLLRTIADESRGGHAYRYHFVAGREMVNIILAACDGRRGNPGDYRDYRLRLINRCPKDRVLSESRPPDQGVGKMEPPN